MKSNNVKENKYKNLYCPKCKSKNFKRNGKRKTENRGLIQRYQCKECRYRFTRDDGFFRMRNHPNKITCALDLFYKGVSTRKVQEHFQAFYPHNSHNTTVYRWVVKYANMISNFTDKLKINSCKEVQVDEMEYHRREEHKKKGTCKDWFIDSIDVKTRYLVSAKYFKARRKQEIREVISRVKYKTEGYVTTITTDGWQVYKGVVKKTWGWNLKEQKYNIIHNPVIASNGEGFNLYIERLHNSIRERTKTFRGFHGSVESADAIMKGYVIFYNFIRKHQSIKCCPYELATGLKLKENNKWLELIRMSKA
jgi:putative transposase